MVAHDFDSSILSVVEHRPWPMPERPWIMTQTWRDLLFAHWPIDVDLLRPLVPDPFELDLFQGEAWLGIVPFQMSNVSLRGIPALPWVSEFPELNVRTYVRVADRPGVYFFSLDAGNRLAVKTARTMLNLPYFSASMNVTPQGRGVLYESRRDDETGQAELVTTYRPIGPPVEPARGSLEYFLTERYCLYNLDRAGKPYRLEIASSAMATPACGGRARSQHDGRAIGHPAPRSAAAAAFLGAPGHGRLGALDARGLSGVSDCAPPAAALFSCR